MDNTTVSKTDGVEATEHERYTGPSLEASASPASDTHVSMPLTGGVLNIGRDSGHDANQPFRLYKRRFIGLVQLTLLNIVNSWCWLTFAPVSTTTSHYFGVSESAVNWLSTGFLFAFVAASPFTVWALNHGVQRSVTIAAILMCLGSWIRYTGAVTNTFGVTVFGQILIGLAQPFVLAAPTRYSDMWFSDKGRIAATALASLANPFGGALGQLIDPFLATKPEEVPDMVLYVAIITTVVSMPAKFMPSKPPTPPNATSFSKKPTLNLETLADLVKNPSFHLIAWPFAIYVSAFNATSSLLNQILHPYGFTEDDAGIDGALLILVGLVAAAISSPIFDRYDRARYPLLRILVPIIAAMYLALIFAPGTRNLAAPYTISAILGAASFALVPLALELLVEVTWPVGPEVSSTVCWAAGQLGGGIFILVMDALRAGHDGNPPRNMHNSLIFQTVMAWVVVPLPLMLGFFGTGKERRVESARLRALEDG